MKKIRKLQFQKLAERLGWKKRAGSRQQDSKNMPTNFLEDYAEGLVILSVAHECNSGFNFFGESRHPLQTTEANALTQPLHIGFVVILGLVICMHNVFISIIEHTPYQILLGGRPHLVLIFV